MEEKNKYIQTLLDSMTEEQRAKAKACKTTDELMKFVSAEKIELPDEMLDAVAGGVVVKNNNGTYSIATDGCGAVFTDGEMGPVLEFRSEELAKSLAKNYFNVSDEVITPEELERRRQAYFQSGGTNS